MAKLKSLSGEAFDRYWLDVFRSHHMAAIMMTKTALAGTAGGTTAKLEREGFMMVSCDRVATMNKLRKQLAT